MALVQELAQPEADLPAPSSDKPVGFLQEDNGHYSTMRLMSFVALITAIMFGGYTIANPQVKEAGINLTFSFLVAAFAPKAIQKFAEEKKPAN